jgi:hypothetical protein
MLRISFKKRGDVRMKAIVSLQMSTIGYQALQAYLNWCAEEIDTSDLQTVLNTLGYKLNVSERIDRVRLAKNLLTEIE